MCGEMITHFAFLNVILVGIKTSGFQRSIRNEGMLRVL